MKYSVTIDVPHLGEGIKFIRTCLVSQKKPDQRKNTQY